MSTVFTVFSVVSTAASVRSRLTLKNKIDMIKFYDAKKKTKCSSPGPRHLIKCNTYFRARPPTNSGGSTIRNL